MANYEPLFVAFGEMMWRNIRRNLFPWKSRYRGFDRHQAWALRMAYRRCRRKGMRLTGRRALSMASMMFDRRDARLRGEPDPWVDLLVACPATDKYLRDFE